MRKGKMHTLLIYMIAALILLGIGGFTLKFPSGLIIRMFLPTITNADLTANPYRDFSGLKAGGDIFRLESTEQYEDGTYTGLDFVTVETSVIIPLKAYRLKDASDKYDSNVYLAGRRAFKGRPLAEYTEKPARRQYLYGRYYLLGLSDGSYVAAYLDQSYEIQHLLQKKIQLPIGRLRMASAQEKIFLEAVADEYSVNTGKVLYMINDDSVEDLKFWDLVIRAGALLIVITAAFAIFVKRHR